MFIFGQRLYMSIANKSLNVDWNIIVLYIYVFFPCNRILLQHVVYLLSNKIDKKSLKIVFFLSLLPQYFFVYFISFVTTNDSLSIWTHHITKTVYGLVWELKLILIRSLTWFRKQRYRWCICFKTNVSEIFFVVA